MTVTNTMTLKSLDGTTTVATLKYVKNASAYPKDVPNFTENILNDGSHAFDVSANPTKRIWELEIVGEDVSDALLSKLNTLKYTECLLDEDALLIETSISVFFKSFDAVLQIGTLYNYKVVLQEL